MNQSIRTLLGLKMQSIQLEGIDPIIPLDLECNYTRIKTIGHGRIEPQRNNSSSESMAVQRHGMQRQHKLRKIIHGL